MTDIANALLRGPISMANIKNIHFCDHGNFMRNGIPRRNFFTSDGYYLSAEGTKVLASNIRCKTELVLNIHSRRGTDNHSRVDDR
jgi:hypothetical protein